MMTLMRVVAARSARSRALSLLFPPPGHAQPVGRAAAAVMVVQVLLCGARGPREEEREGARTRARGETTEREER
jgi:hypothetical protein